MLCPHCHGTRWVRTPDGRKGPCLECGGAGAVHCCDGLQATPDDPAEQLPDPTPAAPPGQDPTVSGKR